MSKQLPCIVCDKALKPAIYDDINQPSRATTFISYGQYGSTFFDPMDGSYLELNVCDVCLERKRDYLLTHNK